MKVAVVTGMCARNDAISAAAADQVAILQESTMVDSVTLFTPHLSRDVACPAHVLQDPVQLVTHPAFATSDVAIFHWGIYYDLFNAVALADSLDPSIVVHFHNCTPEHLMPESSRSLAHRSLLQAQLIDGETVGVWTFSEFNRRTLTSWGIPDASIRMVPFRIVAPRPLRNRRSLETFQIASVGRFVPPKGQLTLVESVALLPKDIRELVRVKFVGNGEFSDPAYIAQVKQRVAGLGLDHHISFLGEPDDEALWQIYESSHAVVSTSLHEGLCVPVVEAYLAGARAVGTTEGNLPFVVQPPDPVVPPNDPEALANAIVGMANPEQDSRWNPRPAVERLLAFHGDRNARYSLEAGLLAAG